MADPEAQLMAEAAAGVPAPPTPSTLPPAVPGAPPAPPPMAPAPAPNPVWEWVRRQWAKLTAPTPSKPSDYSDWKLAIIIDEELDGGAEGPAHTSRLGESIVLVGDHLIRKGAGGNSSPLGHLASSSFEYGWEVWNVVRHEPDPEPQPEPVQDQRQVAPPAPRSPSKPRTKAARGQTAVEESPSEAANRKVDTKARRKR